MKQKINYAEAMPEIIGKLVELGMISEKKVGASLHGLIHNRVSQLNGCAFCLDMDVKKAKLRGESELRMYHIAVWRDSPLFSEKERAALEWAEAVTRLPMDGIPDDIRERVGRHFSGGELAQLTFAIGLTNLWNRLNVAAHTPPGIYDVQFGLDKAGLK